MFDGNMKEYAGMVLAFSRCSSQMQYSFVCAWRCLMMGAEQILNPELNPKIKNKSPELKNIVRKHSVNRSPAFRSYHKHYRVVAYRCSYNIVRIAIVDACRRGCGQW
jgi:hypothetical protein